MTITVKKQFEEIYALLEENQNRKVSTMMPQLIELMQKKNNASGAANTFIKAADGETIIVFCYYHKKWELTSECTYGSKAGTATGLNTMCKEGVSNWTKQQRIKKQAEAGILTKVVAGTLNTEDIPNEQAAIAEESKIIKPRVDGHGYDESEEALEVHNNNVNEEL